MDDSVPNYQVFGHSEFISNLMPCPGALLEGILHPTPTKRLSISVIRQAIPEMDVLCKSCPCSSCAVSAFSEELAFVDL